MFCYLWVQKDTGSPYIGFVEGKNINHPKLIAERRARMKIMPVDPEKDLPVKTIKLLLKQAIYLYKSGMIEIK